MGWIYQWIFAYRRLVGAWHGVKWGLYPADRHVPSIEQICCKNSIEELVAEE